MPKFGCLKYLLVIVDHLTNWVEAVPLLSAPANNVTKILLESIIPQFGLVESIDIDNESHFMANIIKNKTTHEGLGNKMRIPYPTPSIFLLRKSREDEPDSKDSNNQINNGEKINLD
jgi:hypothetical protein